MTEALDNGPGTAGSATSHPAPGLAREDHEALVVRAVSKVFPGVVALDRFSLAIPPGTVHALVGPNGCGKSTFVKILAGIYAPDGYEEALVDGEPLELGSSASAAASGVSFVHQDLGIIEELDAVENVAFGIGFGRRRFGAINWGSQRRRTAELLRSFGDATRGIDPHRPLAEATAVQRTVVAIVRALASSKPGQGLLVLDEPTAALAKSEVDILHRLITDVRRRGTSVLLISHRLDEVIAVADDVTVMRNGQVIADGPIEEMDIPRMTSLIAGADISHVAADAPRDVQHRETASAIRVTGLTGGAVTGVDLEIREGEILGVAGLLGSGREDLPYMVAGAATFPVTGTWEIGGVRLRSMDIRTARNLGIALVPANRKREAVIAGFSVRENLSLPSLPSLRSRFRLDHRRELTLTERWLDAMMVRANAAEAPITVLSGGNQQKVILGRWLATHPTLLVLSEPTAGVDVGARQALHDLLREQAQAGLCVLMASSDVQDLVTACDRVLVVRDGRIVAEFAGVHVTEARIVAAMEGSPTHA